MIDFFRTLFRPAQASGATAKERLRLVLLSDHLSLAPEVVESLKRDLLEVISHYVEIDSDHADVTFEHREREVAMLASIPITGVRERLTGRSAPSAPAEAAPPEPEPPPEPPAALEALLPEIVAAGPAETPAAVAPKVPTPKLASAVSGNAARPRRRRRKKSASPAKAKRALAQTALAKPAAQS